LQGKQAPSLQSKPASKQDSCLPATAGKRQAGFAPQNHPERKKRASLRMTTKNNSRFVTTVHKKRSLRHISQAKRNDSVSKPAASDNPSGAKAHSVSGVNVGAKAPTP
jgi:hypothetical protein